MNELLRLRRPATTGFSTDYTADSVNRFISQRPALKSRPETNEQRSHVRAHAPLPLEHLYPSLYANHSSLVQCCGNYLRAIAINVVNRASAHRRRLESPQHSLSSARAHRLRLRDRTVKS
jgi:hypothetical protein